MDITFHGVRGSIPASGSEFSKFGGHTTCIEVMTDTAQIILDAGSGFQSVKICNDRPVIILLSHFHHDHIQGLGFNQGLFSNQSEIFICSALCSGEETYGHLQTYYSGALFPIELLSEISNLKIKTFKEVQSIFAQTFLLNTCQLNHPGGSAAYSVETTTTKLCCLLDNEYKESQLEILSDFIDEAELTIWDGMFTDNELEKFRGWGHSSVEQGLRLLSQSKCKKLAITHHAPKRTDSHLGQIKKTIKCPDAFLAYENQSFQFE